jgi:L-threonylcarbamoyladenylate synthase
VPPERLLLRTGPAWEEAVARTAEVLSAGGIAVLPAEGVYGYHARVDRGDALARLGRLKPREEGRGYIVLIARPEELARWADAPPRRARALVEAHWPGALTLVLAAAAAVPPVLRGSGGTIALRCPGSDFLRAVLRAGGAPLVSTSANAPGGAPATRAEDAPSAGVDLVVDGGPLSGVPSTVALLEEDEIRVLRPGAVRIRTGRS